MAETKTTTIKFSDTNNKVVVAADEFIGILDGKLKTVRSIELTGDVTGSADFDGSKNVSITTALTNDWFDAGKTIPEGDDLNNYTTIGKYYCSPGNKVTSLSHKPTYIGEDNFVLFVFHRTINTTIQQLIITLAGKIYTRGTTEKKDNSEYEWKAWQEMSTTDHTHDAATTSANGLMSAADKAKLDSISQVDKLNAFLETFTIEE